MCSHVSTEYSFVAPAAAGSNVYPVSFTAFGDLGRGSFDQGTTFNEYGASSKTLAVNLGMSFLKLIQYIDIGYFIM